MTKLVLDCDSLQSISDQIKAQSINMENSADNIRGYVIGETDFDFQSAKTAIANNVQNATKKIENTSKLIDIVIDSHINLQNRLRFTVPSINSVSKTTTTPTTTSSGANVQQSTQSNSQNSIGLQSNGATTMTTTEIETTNIQGKTIEVPEGLGKIHTYMGWQTITNTTSNQYKFRETVGMNFDSEGFARVGDRYVIACTSTFGNVGDLVDFKQSDGTVIECVIGDIKCQEVTSYDRNPANKWGHNDGQCIVEFVVDKNSWYNTNHVNPGNEECHPEWNNYIVSSTNYGSYYDLK